MICFEKTSETVKAINLAILGFQSEMLAVDKGKDNPYFKSKYASYDLIMIPARPILVKNKLIVAHSALVENNELEAVVNVNTRGDKETVSNQIISIPSITLVTRVTHVESEEWKEVAVTMPAEKGNTHGIKGVITYLRRCNVEMLLDIVVCDEDDDGNDTVTPDSDRNYQRPRQDARPRQDTAQSRTTTPAQEAHQKQAQVQQPPKRDLEKEILDTPLQDARQVTENPGSLRELNQQIKNIDKQVNSQPAAQVGSPMTDVQRSRAGVLVGDEYDRMKAALGVAGISATNWKVWLKAKYKVDSIQFILRTDFEAIMETIKMDPKAIDPNAKEVNA